MINRTYSELILLPTFEERLEYLRIKGKVGEDTFGYNRIFNQHFYSSKEWKLVRNKIIERDYGRDLAIPGREIFSRRFIYIHHLNPITVEDIKERTEILLEPEFLVCTSFETHNAIHYGRKSLQPEKLIERKPFDTCPWRKS